MDTSEALQEPASPSPSRGLLGSLPMFSQPRKMPVDGPLPEDENQHPSQHLGEGTSPSEPGSPKPATSATPTPTSGSTGDRKADPKATTALVAGLLGLAFTGLAVAIKWRTRRVLREPTKGDLDDMAGPLARIAGRHLDTSVVNADLADAVKAAGALGAYLKDGPLTQPDYPDAGVPADLHNVEEYE